MGANIAVIYAGNQAAADAVCETCREEYGVQAKAYPMEGFCFTRDNGKVLNPQAPTSYLARFGKKYGVENLHPHALRHTMATISIANGADIVSVSEKLGHAETSVTLDVYSHVNKQAQNRANQVLSQALYAPQKRCSKASLAPSKKWRNPNKNGKFLSRGIDLFMRFSRCNTAPGCSRVRSTSRFHRPANLHGSPVG